MIITILTDDGTHSFSDIDKAIDFLRQAKTKWYTKEWTGLCRQCPWKNASTCPGPEKSNCYIYNK